MHWEGGNGGKCDWRRRAQTTSKHVQPLHSASLHTYSTSNSWRWTRKTKGELKPLTFPWLAIRGRGTFHKLNESKTEILDWRRIAKRYYNNTRVDHAHMNINRYRCVGSEESKSIKIYCSINAGVAEKTKMMQWIVSYTMGNKKAARETNLTFWLHSLLTYVYGTFSQWKLFVFKIRQLANKSIKEHFYTLHFP